MGLALICPAVCSCIYRRCLLFPKQSEVRACVCLCTSGCVCAEGGGVHVPCVACRGLGIFCVSASEDFGWSFVDPVFVDPVLL